ncbi:MAG: hypothetical protein AAFY56_17055 [Pseudomonadota bacterium]
MRDVYRRRYRPQDQLEAELVEALVNLVIKLRQLDRLELEGAGAHLRKKSQR